VLLTVIPPDEAHVVTLPILEHCARADMGKSNVIRLMTSRMKPGRANRGGSTERAAGNIG
jgi:hypothetical protein